MIDEIQGNIRFLPTGNGIAYDGDGNEIKCACGGFAVDIIQGKDAYVAYCNKCAEKNLKGIGKIEGEHFVYIPPPEKCTPYISDCRINLVEKKHE